MAGARDHRDLGAEDAALVVVADLGLVGETMAAAGDQEVVVAVDAQLDRPLQPRRRHRRDAGEQRRLRLLAAEAAAHAPAFDLHRVRGPAQRLRNQVLHLARVLGRAPDLHAGVLGRQRIGDLPFEVELLLAADLEARREPVRRARDRRGRIAAAQVHRRHDVLGRGMGLLRRQHRRQRVGAHQLARLRRRAPRRGAGLGDHRNDRLSEVAQRRADGSDRARLGRRAGEDRVVADERAAVVDARNVGRGDDVDHAGQRAQRVEVDGAQHAMRQRRQAERGVQRAGELGQVVGVGCGAGHVQVGGLVRQAGAGDGFPVGEQRPFGWLVHAFASRLQTLSARSGSGSSARVSSHSRCSRLPATRSR